jgi:hypothetical protein
MNHIFGIFEFSYFRDKNYYIFPLLFYEKGAALHNDRFAHFGFF